jgi:threonine synthase
MGPLGVLKGFLELQQMGLSSRIPALGIIQADGCAPMVDAWNRGLMVAEPVRSPRTHIETLATGDPGRAYGLLRNHVERHGGSFQAVTDEETFRAMHILAKMEGISAEPAAAAAFAGLFKLIRAGVIKSTDTVVVNCTGHTMPAEQLVLGESWSHDIDAAALADRPEEGLLAALSQVAPDRFPCVAIVEDSADARRLIRRILQSQGNFEILEAENGRLGLELIRSRLPDLVILDIMMPEMDGFAVLDAMRANTDTASIPVIVATAKELTSDEQNRLGGQIQSLMQKGNFLNDEFLAEVRSLIHPR